MNAPRATALWLLFAGPAVWAAHFLVSYVFAAVWCAKTGAGLGPVRLAVALLTAAALVLLAALGVYGWRRRRTAGAEPRDDRRRFTGMATLLLVGLSAVATIYVAIVVIFFESCR